MKGKNSAVVKKQLDSLRLLMAKEVELTVHQAKREMKIGLSSTNSLFTILSEREEIRLYHYENEEGLRQWYGLTYVGFSICLTKFSELQEDWTGFVKRIFGNKHFTVDKTPFMNLSIYIEDYELSNILKKFWIKLGGFIITMYDTVDKLGSINRGLQMNMIRGAIQQFYEELFDNLDPHEFDLMYLKIPEFRNQFKTISKKYEETLRRIKELDKKVEK